MFILFIHGKISKKSNTVYRVRNNKQQCYQLTQSTKPATAKQTAGRQTFKQINALVWADLKNPTRKAHWEQIAASSNIPNYTARKAAFAHYKITLNTTENTETKTTSTNNPPTPHHTPPMPTHEITIRLFLSLFLSTHKHSHSNVHTNKDNLYPGQTHEKIIQSTFEQL